MFWAAHVCKAKVAVRDAAGPLLCDPEGTPQHGAKSSAALGVKSSGPPERKLPFVFLPPESFSNPEGPDEGSQGASEASVPAAAASKITPAPTLASLFGVLLGSFLVVFGYPPEDTEEDEMLL